jgi:zinc transporter ZupT
VPSLSAVAIAVLVGIALPLGLLAGARALGGSTSEARGAVPELPRLLQLALGAILVFCLVPFMVALGGLDRGYTVVEMLLFAALLGAAALYVARAGSRGWG